MSKAQTLEELKYVTEKMASFIKKININDAQNLYDSYLVAKTQDLLESTLYSEEKKQDVLNAKTKVDFILLFNYDDDFKEFIEDNFDKLERIIFIAKEYVKENME